MEGRADWNTFRGNIKALSFMPGQWQTFDMSEEYVCWPMYDQFCIHFSAPEPVVAEFEIALDNVLQDYTMTASVEAAFRHAIAIGKCKTPRIITIRRKESDDERPVFVIAVDGVPPNSQIEQPSRLLAKVGSNAGLGVAVSPAPTFGGRKKCQ